MPYTRQDILTQNINTYPNNNSGQITPDSVKSFNQNWIDSVVFTDQTGSLVVTSASFAQNAGAADTANTASFTPNAFVSASVNLQTIRLTKGNGQFTDLLVSVSGSVASASFANTATSASYAATASFFIGNSVSASYAATASYPLLGVVTASASLISPVITFTKGDGTTFDVTVAQSGSVVSSSFANTASFAATASFALNAPIFNTGSLTTTASFNAYTASNNAAIADILVETASLNAATASLNAYTASQNGRNGTYSTTASFNAYTASTNTFTGSIQTQVNALQAATSSYVKNAQTSSMSVLSASFASTVAAGLNISASNITVANNLVVNGTASFAYTKTSSGSAIIIGDAFIILNADTPTQPFAGIKVYDTGSAATASFEWNGNNDYWITVEESGASAGVLTGASGSKGFEVFPSLNRLTKGTGNNTIINSNVTDTGTLVSINSNTEITGSLGVTGTITGTLSGTASFANNSTSASYARVATSASYAATASGADVFTVRTALTASGLNYPTADGAFTGQVLQTNAAGTLSFGNVATTYETIRNGEATNLTKGTVVYISGSQGDTPIVYRADNTNPLKMPASYVIQETIAVGATGRGVVLGQVTGIDVGSLVAGTQLYVDGSGVLTNVRPTGSADIVQPFAVVTKTGTGGAINVLNPGPVLLPNLQTGYAWVGNGSNQPVAVATSSIQNVVSSSFATNAGAAQTATSASFATTASFALNVPATASFAISASFANSAGAAQTAISSSFATNASTAISASFASSAAAAQTATSASFAISASFANAAGAAQTATSSSFASTAAVAQTATSASFATTASFALATAGGLQGSEIYSYTFLLMGA